MARPGIKGKTPVTLIIELMGQGLNRIIFYIINSGMVVRCSPIECYMFNPREHYTKDVFKVESYTS